MIIETKHSINDEVYILYGNKIYKGQVTGIGFVKSNNLCSWSEEKLEYCVNILPVKQEVVISENLVFSTKEELIASL